MTYKPEKYLMYLNSHRKRGIEADPHKAFPRIKQDPSGRTPEVAMMEYESKGINPESTPCTDVCKLAFYIEGKWARDFLVTEWKQAVKSKFFLAEEFLESINYDVLEFISIFGRPPDLLVWRAITGYEFQEESPLVGYVRGNDYY